MSEHKPKSRTGASKPGATRHLDEGRKQALDLHADAEHTDGKTREKLTRKIEQFGDAATSSTG